MLYKSLLCSLIIVRCYNKTSVNACRLCFLWKFNSCLSTVRTCSCNNRNSLFNIISSKSYSFNMLFFCHSCRLTSCSTDNNRICWIINLIIKKLCKLIIVDFSIGFHWCDNSDTCTCKYWHNSSIPTLIRCININYFNSIPVLSNRVQRLNNSFTIKQTDLMTDRPK